MDSLIHDVRYAFRQFRGSPLFTVVAVLVIALGAGGVTTIFSAMNAVLLRPLPGAEEPHRLVDIERTGADGQGSLSASYPYYETLRDGSQGLRAVAAWSNVTLSIAPGDEAVVGHGNIVSGNYFDVLGVRPALGRFFLPEEDRTPLSDPVVVVSQDFWRTRLGADSTLVGGTLTVNGRPFTLVGVAPAGFRGVVAPLRTDAWVPFAMQPLVRPGGALDDPSAAWLRVFGRLNDDVSREAARTELASLTEAHAERSGEPMEFRSFTGVNLTSMTGLPRDARRAALGFTALLLVAAMLVLVIASVNVATMLSARALARRREMAVRTALGAPRGRIVRQVLTETVLLFVLGAGGGLALAFGGTRALEHLPLPGSVPIVLDLAPDVRVLAFALGTALLTGLLFGLVPALRATGESIPSRLREASQASGRRRGRLGDALVVGQLALSLVLIVAAGLFLRALDRGQSMDPGFDPAGVATASFDTRSWGYEEPRGREFYRMLRERLEALPEVTAVSTSGFLPLALGSSGGEIDVDGSTVPVQYSRVDHDYFEVLRMPIVQGRGFVAADDGGAERVAVINETLARRHWPDGEALGSTFVFRDESVRVVGVARDAKYASLSEDTPAYLFLPVAQSWIPAQSLLVRTAGDPARLRPVLTDLVHDLDPALPPPTVTTLEQEASVVLLPQRVAAWVTGLLGALGLLLAGVGLYGLVAYSAALRSREIGIRMALGARGGDVRRMIVWRGLRLAGTGVVIGLLLSLAASRALSGLLFGLSPLDAVTFAGTSALFLAVAILASYLPARRAASRDPIAVLREE